MRSVQANETIMQGVVMLNVVMLSVVAPFSLILLAAEECGLPADNVLKRFSSSLSK